MCDPCNILFHQTQSVNSSKITMTSTEECEQKENEEDLDMKNVYKCLAFDDFIIRRE